MVRAKTSRRTGRRDAPDSVQIRTLPPNQLSPGRINFSIQIVRPLPKWNRPLGRRTGILKKVYDIEPVMQSNQLGKDRFGRLRGRACSSLYGGAFPEAFTASGHAERAPA